MKFIHFRFSSITGLIHGIHLLHHIIHGVKAAGFDIHRIIPQTNTTIGVTEVRQKEWIEEKTKAEFLFQGYAVAVGNFNGDDNQGKVSDVKTQRNN